MVTQTKQASSTPQTAGTAGQQGVGRVHLGAPQTAGTAGQQGVGRVHSGTPHGLDPVVKAQPSRDAIPAKKAKQDVSAVATPLARHSLLQPKPKTVTGLAPKKMVGTTV